MLFCTTVSCWQQWPCPLHPENHPHIPRPDELKQAGSTSLSLPRACVNIEQWLPAGVRRIDATVIKEEDIGIGTSADLRVGSWQQRKTRPTRVALKRFVGVARNCKEFFREVHILQLVRHENILQMHGVVVGKSDEVKLVLEYMPKTLEPAALDSSTKILEIFIGISAGLEYLHGLRLVHRDIKPSNILLNDLQAKICDFSIAKDTELVTSSDGGVMGTMPYMAPELLNPTMGHWSQDMYSFGLVLRECLTKTPAFKQNSMFQIMSLVQSGVVPLDETKFKDPVSVRLARVANACTVLDPSSRPTAETVHTVLGQLRNRGMQFFDRIVVINRQMVEEDKVFYGSHWAEATRQQPFAAERLRRILAKLTSTKFEFPALQRCESNFESLRELATPAMGEEFHKQLHKFVTATRGDYHRGPRKLEERIHVKVARDYEGDYRRLLDYERGTGAWEDLDALETALSHLTELLSVARVKDRVFGTVLDTGYKDILINVHYRGFVGELQCTLRSIWEYKVVNHRRQLVERELNEMESSA